MPGMNWSTSVFSVPELNLMLLMHCDKITPHRQAAAQMRHTLAGHFMYHTSENNILNYTRLVMIVKLWFF